MISIPGTHPEGRVMVFEPGGETLGRTLGQEIDRAAPFQVDEDGAVAVSAPEGEIIDAEDARRGPLLRVDMLQMPQQGIRAEAKTEALGDLSGGFPSNQIGQFS